jgi:glutathione S-transferase
MREGAGSHERVLTGALDTLSTELAGRGGYLVGGRFTYADIAMAMVLQGVSPVSERFMAVGPGGREGWTNEALKARYPELLAWRDDLYEKHRAKRGS